MTDTKHDGGGPVYPTYVDQCEGMSLRDYFAGQALEGILAMASSESIMVEMSNRATRGNIKVSEVVAVKAYNFADAMIKERGG